MRSLAERSRVASFTMQATSTSEKNFALRCVREELSSARVSIWAANDLDKLRAEKDGVDDNLKARLNVSGDKFESLLRGVDALVRAEDLVGKTTLKRELTEGLVLERLSCPIGVVCVVFESRPEAAVQISSLAVKSGNCVILKGGKEAAESNQALVEAMRCGLEKAGLPKDAIQLVTTREDVSELLKMNDLIDLVVPRGSNQLVTSVMRSTSIPVLGHADGICSVYLDAKADPEIAIKVAVDAKCDYPAACNAAETLLVHSSLLDTLLPRIGVAMAAKGVKFVADARCFPKLPSTVTELAKPDFKFDMEYLQLKISVKAVDSLDEAVIHCNTHGSHHTDVIITSDEAAANQFSRRVDSAGVYHNCSSRFADGFRYGFGAELGVSTNRVHARGPVGMEGLLTYKYTLKGNGHVVGGMKSSDYTHADLPFDSVLSSDAKRAKMG